jgi:hypothetical protein
VDAFFDKDGDKRIIEATAEKVMSGYALPIATIQNVSMMGRRGLVRRRRKPGAWVALAHQLRS